MYKGNLEGFPKEVVELMLQRQEEQGNKKDISVFEKDNMAGIPTGGFTWEDTIEDYDFWAAVIDEKKFDVFFEKYPKTKNLPEYFVIKRDGANSLWQKYIDWLKNTGKGETWWDGQSEAYYGFDKDRPRIFSRTQKFSIQILTLEEWDNIINNKTQNM